MPLELYSRTLSISFNHLTIQCYSQLHLRDIFIESTTLSLLSLPGHHSLNLRRAGRLWKGSLYKETS